MLFVKATNLKFGGDGCRINPLRLVVEFDLATTTANLEH
jgi:hypothetical protein